MWVSGGPSTRWITLLGVAASAMLTLLGAVQGQVVLLATGFALCAAILRQARLIEERGRLAASLQQAIDQERSLRDRLVRSARMAAVGELASGVAHEVNNPLTSILGYTELLIAESAADSSQRADLETIREEAIRARGIVRALIDFARPRPPHMVTVDLVELVEGSVELVRPAAVRSGIQVLEAYAELPQLLLDPAAIQEAVVNVVSNAMTALSHGGTLRVTVVREAATAVVRVEDDGLGMDDDTRERAFLPFFSLAGGRGLGLSVALGLVEGHGGSISLASADRGGTVAEIRLPIVEVPPGIAADRSGPATVAA